MNSHVEHATVIEAELPDVLNYLVAEARVDPTTSGVHWDK